MKAAFDTYAPPPIPPRHPPTYLKRIGKKNLKKYNEIWLDAEGK